MNAAAAEFMKDTPMYQLYQRVAPRPEDFPRLLDKIGEAMAKDFDFTEEVRGLQVPTLIVAADADMAPPSHYVEVFKLLDGGLRDGGWMGEGRPKGGHALAILPGLTHYNLASLPAVRRGHPRLPRRAAELNGPSDGRDHQQRRTDPEEHQREATRAALLGGPGGASVAASRRGVDQEPGGHQGNAENLDGPAHVSSLRVRSLPRRRGTSARPAPGGGRCRSAAGRAW